MTSDAQWRTVCVSYHDEQTMTELILDAVQPLFVELSERHGLTDVYFQRHWRRGPHLRLNVWTTAEGMCSLVLPAVQRWVGSFLRARPSLSTVDLERLLPAHRRLAASELDSGALWPPRPDNHIGVEPYEARTHIVGGDEAASFFADFHVAATPAAFTALSAMRAQGQRLWTAFELMIATAHAFSGGGVQLGFVSFRTHAEIFLARSPDQQRTRAEWERTYRDAMPALRARLDAVTSQVGGAGPCATWIRALEAIRDRGFDLVDSGALRMDLAAAEPAPPAGTAPAGATPFLLALLGMDDFRDRMMPSPRFRHYRLLLNLLYLQLTKLGIRPAERSMLGHLLANTVEAVYGVDAATLVAQTSAKARYSA